MNDLIQMTQQQAKTTITNKLLKHQAERIMKASEQKSKVKDYIYYKKNDFQNPPRYKNTARDAPTFSK